VLITNLVVEGSLLESPAIVGSRIDAVRFSAVVMIGMAFIFVSVWFLFLRGRTFGYFEN
jgi:hypothetical protein